MTKDVNILERNALRLYGCSLATAIETNDGLPLRQYGTKANRYFSQRTKARRRGIAWEISFPEWAAVWMDSGRWEERGVGLGRYCMARHGDVGPYKVGNVSIQTNDTNCGDGGKKSIAGRHQWHGPQLGSGRGWTYLPNRKSPYQVTLGGKYLGVFKTQEEAEAAHAEAVRDWGLIHGDVNVPSFARF